MAQKRKQYSSQQKMMILRKHLLDGVPVSEVCDEYGIQPSVFYRWQKLLFEQGQQLFEGGHRGAKKQQRQIEALEKKLSQKDEVLVELMEEYVALKKSSGSA